MSAEGLEPPNLTGGDIPTGLPRVEEPFEARKTPKGEAVVAEIGGTAHGMQSDRYSDLRMVRIDHGASGPGIIRIFVFIARKTKRNE